MLKLNKTKKIRSQPGHRNGIEPIFDFGPSLAHSGRRREWREARASALGQPILRTQQPHKGGSGQQLGLKP